MQTTTIISYLDVSSTTDDIKGAVFQRAYKLIIYDAQIKKSLTPNAEPEKRDSKQFNSNRK
jgi:hypothetical protein